tara:strand:- start:328 stop:759 length:432 start_codon:yes stop_codon:yes gene_type:complete
MAKRTSAKTAAANKKGAKTQPLRTYKTKGGAQQYGSAEDFEKQEKLAFDRYMKAVKPYGYSGQDLDELSAINNSLSAGTYSAPRSYGQLSEEIENISMEAAKNAFKRSKNKKTTKKAKGGKVRAFKNGGAVMSGRGPKFKGQT